MYLVYKMFQSSNVFSPDETIVFYFEMNRDNKLVTLFVSVLFSNNTYEEIGRIKDGQDYQNVNKCNTGMKLLSMLIRLL